MKARRLYILYLEPALYVVVIPVLRMLPDAIIDIAVDDADDHADDEEPQDLPTVAETTNTLRLLRNSVECNCGYQHFM